MRAPLFVLLIGTFVFASCDPLQDDEGLFCVNEREVPSEDLYSGEVSALLNGEPWIVFPLRGALFARTGYEGEPTMILWMSFYDVRNGYPIPHPSFSESLYFRDIPRRLGTYPLPLPGVSESQGHYFHAHVHGYDVASGLDYYLDISEEAFISIDAYDPSTCTIQGTFALTVVNTQPKDMYRYVDTLRFTEGRFHTHVVAW